MKCIILAAGRSERLRQLTSKYPKCLLPVGEKPLLQRIITHVLSTGITDIALVVGYKEQRIRTFLKATFPRVNFTYIKNPKFASTNNAFSLSLAKEFYLSGLSGLPKKALGAKRHAHHSLLLLDSDLIFHRELLPFFIRQPFANRIAVRVQGLHDEEEMRVQINRRGNLLRIGKTIPLPMTLGESVGIEIFSPPAAVHLFEILDRRIEHGPGKTEFYETGFQQMVDEGVRIQAVDISRYPVAEIDTKKDIEYAQRAILPRLSDE